MYLTCSGFFEQNFSDVEGFNNRSVHFGEFIDQRFKFFIKNDADVPSIGTCLVESEYWGKAMSSDDLIPLLKKSSNLSLIFCKSFKLSKSINSIVSYCKKQKVNVFKLEEGEDGYEDDEVKEYKLISLSPNLPIIEDAAKTCIVLVSDVINLEET